MLRPCKYLLLSGVVLAVLSTAFGEDSENAGEASAEILEERLPDDPLPDDTPPPEDPSDAVQPVESLPVERPEDRAAKVRSADGKVHVYRVPITAAISKPNFFILRRSVKQAMEKDVQVIVIDMDTPGGRLDVTLDMMETLDRFAGDTITYVNKDAISAGAYISMVTDAIYFAPNGVMGAAAVVAGSGQEIDESMKAKINSYLLARMRSYTERFPYRSEVIRAMADLDYELKIDDTVLKPAGELLSLTASEATTLYGSPARPLLADGIAATLEDLLTERYGEGAFVLESFEISWSEELAKYLDAIAPILLGLGLLLLFVEFKTPGFGIFGISGLVLVGIVFASNYLAGLAGFEVMLFFILGLILIVVEIFLLPGTFIFMILGLLLIVGSLLWSLSDIWPVPDGDGPGGLSFTVQMEAVWLALYQLLGAFVVAAIGLWIIWRFLPNTAIYGRLVHTMAGAMPDPVITGGGEIRGGDSLPDVGSRGVVATAMHPLGEVIINGQRYQASVAIGSLDKGMPVVVTGYKHFNLLVEPSEESSQ